MPHRQVGVAARSARGGSLAALVPGGHAQGRNRPLEPTNGCQRDSRGGTAWIRACQRRRPRRAWGSRQVWTFTSRTFFATSGPTAMSVGAAALGVVRQRSVPVVRWLSEYEMSSKWVSGGGVGRGVAGGSAARCCGSAGWDSPVRRPAAPGPARGGRLAAPGLGEHAQGRNRPLEPTDGCQHDARGGRAWIRACQRRRSQRAWGSRQVWTFTSRTFFATSGSTARSVGPAALGAVW